MEIRIEIGASDAAIFAKKMFAAREAHLFSSDACLFFAQQSGRAE